MSFLFLLRWQLHGSILVAAELCEREPTCYPVAEFMNSGFEGELLSNHLTI